MNPEEKAKDLLSIFKGDAEDAISTCEEILKTYEEIGALPESPIVEYWNKVKQELCKL